MKRLIGMVVAVLMVAGPAWADQKTVEGARIVAGGLGGAASAAGLSMVLQSTMSTGGVTVWVTSPLIVASGGFVGMAVAALIVNKDRARRAAERAECDALPPFGPRTECRRRHRGAPARFAPARRAAADAAKGVEVDLIIDRSDVERYLKMRAEAEQEQLEAAPDWFPLTRAELERQREEREAREDRARERAGDATPAR